jgi:hypothetical protein
MAASDCFERGRLLKMSWHRLLRALKRESFSAFFTSGFFNLEKDDLYMKNYGRKTENVSKF